MVYYYMLINIIARQNIMTAANGVNYSNQIKKLTKTAKSMMIVDEKLINTDLMHGTVLSNNIRS